MPLAVVGVAGCGAVARELARRVLARDDEALARLQGVAGRGVLVLMGAAEELPWVDGVVYLGRDAAAPQLLMPTNQRPSAPAGLIERAVRARFGELTPPLVVLPGAGSVLSVHTARAVAREVLREWLGERG